MSFLLDTDICSAYLKGNHQVWKKFMQYSGRLDISAVTAAELFVWALRAKASPKKLQGVLDLMNDMTFLDVDGGVSRKFGELRASQLDQGQFTPDMDFADRRHGAGPQFDLGNAQRP
jgi:tRNA(fMet)-specific endonuclease VapC